MSNKEDIKMEGENKYIENPNIIFMDEDTQKDPEENKQSDLEDNKEAQNNSNSGISIYINR